MAMMSPTFYNQSGENGDDPWSKPYGDGLPSFLSNGSQFSSMGPDGQLAPAPGLTPDQLQFAYGGGNAQTPAATPAAAPTATGGGPTGSAGQPVWGTDLLAPFTQQFTPPPAFNWQTDLPQAPSYTAPRWTPPSYKPPPAFSYQDFVGPDENTVTSRPGYQTRLNEGERALGNAKAAQGIYGTGATLKAILGYGQDYAANEFQKEWEREMGGYQANRANAVDTYNTNYGTQYVDPYRIAYQGAQDAFAPQMAEFNANVGAGNLAYSTEAAAAQRGSENQYASAWDQYLLDYNKFRNRQQDTFAYQWPVVSA